MYFDIRPEKITLTQNVTRFDIKTGRAAETCIVGNYRETADLESKPKAPDPLPCNKQIRKKPLEKVAAAKLKSDTFPDTV